MTVSAVKSQDNGSFDFDIAIVGAGMVGITAALLLAKRLPSLSIALFDQYALAPRPEPFQPSFDQRATALAAGSLEALAELNLSQQLQAVSGKINRVQVSDKGHWSGTGFSAEKLALEQLGLVVPNAALGQCLMTQLAQSTIARIAPIGVERVAAIAGGYRLASSEQTFATRLLILADGASDTLKKQLGIASSRTEYLQSAVIANLRCEKHHQGVAYERFTADGPMAMLPLADPQVMALVWTLKAQDQHLADLPDAEFLVQAQRRFGDRLGNFVALSKRDVYPLALVEAQEQVRAHLVLLGNAAHFLHPVAGQGFNLSVRDTVALVETIEQSVQQNGLDALGQLSDLLDYQAKRGTDQWLTTQYSHQLVNWFSSDHWLHFIPRQSAMMLLNNLPLAKQWLANQSMGRA
ncbi:FAD-dependent monooxygenase [Simiduia curdlanivorans]|uniref:FAD-dependent monooxygenase n=1 Tax=Simiduia curdlanivorans TaxID=1492769 RepID=A0ABV8V6F9_9GAMM|nr:FAD-dependent monooxygenase [Simiduia curdlanivorans]MDN3637434.1 FAD-dependent monooxygenase [Simiduia curdlanivorans]